MNITKSIAVVSQSTLLRESTFPMHRVKAKHGSIYITGPNTFDVTDGSTIYQDLSVPDTHNLHIILDVLDNPKWTEAEIDAAVKNLNRDTKQEERGTGTGGQMKTATPMPAPDSNRVKELIGSFHAVKGAWSGTSYGYHPHGVVRRGIIFTDHHNTSGSHEAYVILEPESGLIYPPTDADSSRCGCKSKACIRPKSGGTVLVYRNGRWEGPDGPWQKRICEILDELEHEVEALRDARKREIEAKNQEGQRKQEEMYAKASAALEREDA